MTGSTFRRRWGRMLILAALSSLVVPLAACYQPQGDTLQATTVSLIATFTPLPSLTPDGPPTETPFQLVALTNTPDALAEAQTQVALAAQQVPAGDIDPFSATATAMALGLSQPLDMPLDMPADPMMQTATEMARGIILPTTDPLQPVGPTMDPLFLTATAYIQGATQTAEAPMTQTAAALFPPQPTAFATLPPFTTATVVPPTGSCTHVVQAGENLFRISLRYNTTVDAIAAANGIVNPSLILVGQQLIIPNCGSSGGTVVQPVPPTSGVQPGEQVHIVRQGETMMSISLTYGVPVNSIAARNNLANPNLIFINQELIIPVA